MDTINSEPIGVREVMGRYLISSPSTLKKWLEKAGIKTFIKGRNRYIYTYQLAVLDAIARERNRPINTSSSENVETISTEHFQQFQEPEVSEMSDTGKFMTWFLEVLQPRINPIDPDENLVRLERYAVNSWRIDSKNLATLLGLKNMPKSPYKARGFLFQREGREWKISKLEE